MVIGSIRSRMNCDIYCRHCGSLFLSDGIGLRGMICPRCHADALFEAEDGAIEIALSINHIPDEADRMRAISQLFMRTGGDS